MAPLRVGYVHEHFASPLLQYQDADAGKSFNLVGCPGGTGQLIKALTDDQVDVVVALTDALLAGIAKGSEYKLVGSYVSEQHPFARRLEVEASRRCAKPLFNMPRTDSPLNWAIVTGTETKYESRRDLRGTTFGISRKGSGSELMVKLMARQEGWTKEGSKDLEEINFKVCDNLDGLKTAVNDGSCSCFLWEWFTTKPYVDAGEVRFIGSVPTPWPSWSIAAHISTTRAPIDAVITFVATLNSYVTDFNSQASRVQKNVDYIKKHFKYPEEDIRAWLRTVEYPEDCTKLDGAMICKTLATLADTGVVVRPEAGFVIESFTNINAVRTE
ncbi:hypothetical protein FRB96_004553 [Tulasnella sp. 330]|nr:hypothetical protein FRB96_004553 [Tulasnella sp. 330]